MRNILITGGLGFVGSHLADSLIEDGCSVTIVDNLQSNVVPAEFFSGRCSVVVDSIESYAKQSDAGLPKFDEIYHLASMVGPAGVLQYAGEIAMSVIASGDCVTQMALRHGSRLILASTSEVYGRPGNLSEDIDCLVPANFTIRLEYAAAKLTSEIAALNKAKVAKLHVNIVRPFNIAGPRQLPDGGFVLPRFVVAALTGEPLTVFGDGTQIRAFTDVRDIVSGLKAMMRMENSGLVLNLGNPANEISIKKLADVVVAQSQSQSPIALVDPQTLFGSLYAEGTERVPNVSKALQLLDWKPRFSLEETVKDTLEFYRSRPDLLKAPQLQTSSI